MKEIICKAQIKSYPNLWYALLFGLHDWTWQQMAATPSFPSERDCVYRHCLKALPCMQPTPARAILQGHNLYKSTQ